ncbi:hypothetical protein DYB32_001111, partial [Aphanomyces invadans]
KRHPPMKPTPRAKFGYNARTFSTSNKDSVAISSLINADITLKVLYEAHGQGLEKDDKAILSATLRTATTVVTKLEALLMKYQRLAGDAGIPRIGADMKRHAAKCSSCGKKFALLSRETNCFLTAVDVATDEGHLPHAIKNEILAAVGPTTRLAVTTAGIIMGKLKHVLASIVAHYEYHDDMDSNESDSNDGPTPLQSSLPSPSAPPMLSLADECTSRKSTQPLLRSSKTHLTEKKCGVPAQAIQSILSLMVLLDAIPSHEDMPNVVSVLSSSHDGDDLNPLTADNIAHDAATDDEGVHPNLEDEGARENPPDGASTTNEADSRTASSSDTSPSKQHKPSHDEFDPTLEVEDRGPSSEAAASAQTTSYYVTLFRKASDRYRLNVHPHHGVIRVTSIMRGTNFSSRFADFNVQSIVSDAVRLCFVHRSDVVYQFASDALKDEFCALVEAYKLAHPHVVPRRLPLVPLLKGERKMHMSRFPATAVLAGDCHVRGIVMVTNYRLLFLPLEENCPALVEMPLFAIVSVLRGVVNGFNKDPTNRLQTTLAFTCKDVRALRLDVDEDRVEHLHALVHHLAECTQRNNPVHFLMTPTTPDAVVDIPHFAFSYAMTNFPIDGWQFAAISREYDRLGLRDNAEFQCIDNENGDVCDSYPPTLVLPAALSQSSIASAAGFRAKNRLPVVTWIHPVHNSVLARSSQPLLGRILSGTSCNMDESIVKFYRNLPGTSKPFYIFDARKSKAATGNRLMGKGGVETSENYDGAIIYHLDIANMYKMQSSYLGTALPPSTTCQSITSCSVALAKICIVPEYDKTWWSAVEVRLLYSLPAYALATRWFEHLHLILDGASRIARVLEVEGASALVHCSDGWDRTCQLVCLAQIMLDPYYRTLHGFATLVEKDWCLFGHKRLGGNRGKDPMRDKMSPVFFQFLDAVYQMVAQFPNAFEFNEHCLLHVANALTSGLYGTFVYDSYQHRKLANVEARTVSVWTPLCAASSFFLNPDYTPVHGPLWVWTGHQALKLWANYFFQHHEIQATHVTNAKSPAFTALGQNDVETMDPPLE